MNLRLLPAPPADPTKIPPDAPGVTVAEGITDFYLLVSSDPANTTAPVRMQIINAGADKLKIGQTLWFNLTKNAVAGTLGTEKLMIQPGARTILDAPTTVSGDYPSNCFTGSPATKFSIRSARRCGATTRAAAAWPLSSTKMARAAHG